VTEPRVVLLGPQYHRPTVGAVLADLGIRGRVATITAGWQEWETEDAALLRQIGPRALPIRLYARAERIWESDPELRVAHRAMQDELRILRDLYNQQLDPAADAWMALLAADGPEHLIGPERAAALEAIQRIDQRHIDRIEAVQAEYRERMRPGERAAVRAQHAAIAERLAEAEAVVIEGGHAAVLRNRLALFEVPPLLADKTIIGCAAGAMILCRRVVLYNDSPAIGRGHAEVSLPGFGLAPGIVALPDATHRLRLRDGVRMRRLADRIAPDACALLDPGARLDWDGDQWTGSAERIAPDGSPAAWESAA